MSTEEQLDINELRTIAETASTQGSVTVVEPSPYIITLDELKATQEALASKESVDRSNLYRFVEPDVDELKRRLINWASSGFPDGFIVFLISVQIPNKCLDGERRDLFNYINYLLNSTLGEKLQLLNAKLPGMILSYSLPGDQICMHVSKS